MSVKLAKVSSYQIIKELQGQGEAFDCFDSQLGTNDKSQEKDALKI